MAHVLLLPLQAARRTDVLALRPVHPRIILRGFQLYAVEKWLVDRSRSLTLLTVYTGHYDHLLPVAAYTPIDLASWDNIISFLKRDGARQRPTDHGSIMVTSLAHFRSDYTIVHIPDGDFPLVRDYLYVNINILRMNCSGRSALTLEEPSDSTKDRFISTYLIPDISIPDSRTKDRNIFTATVLELVKLIQAGLSLFGMYSGPLDGLLCDTTVDGIRRWIADIGEPIIGLEPTERIADPMFVSALLSLVLSIRNKLSALGYSQHVPKDPFLQPQTLSNALAAFVQNTSPFTGPPSSNTSIITPSSSLQGHFLPHLAHTHSLSMPNHPFHATLAPPPSPIAPRIIVLNQSLIEAIDSAYDIKHRPTETRKVRRVIKEKLDDLAGVVAGTAPDSVSEQGTPDLARRGNQSSLDFPGAGDRIGSGSLVGNSSTLGGIASGFGLSGGTSGLSSLVDPTVNLTRFVKTVVGGAHGASHGWTRGKSKSGKQRESVDLGMHGYGKDKDKDKDAGSVRALWSGNISHLLKMREWQELSSITERDRESSRWRDRLAVGVLSEGEEGVRGKTDGRTTEEESDQVAAGPSFWSDKMQRTLESWAGRRGRQRVSASLDLTVTPTKGSNGSKLAAARKNDLRPSLPVAPFPINIPPNSPIVSDDDDLFLSSGQVSPQAPHFFGTPELPRIRNSTFFPLSPSRFKTPAPRVTASVRDDLSDIGTSFEDATELPYSVCRDDAFVGRQKRGLSPERRRSYHDSGSLQDMVILTPEQMRIDVELCGQMLIMVRRQDHLRDVISCLQVLESSLSTTSSLLREDYEAHHEFIASLDPASVLSDINGEYKKAEEFSQQTNTLVYESEQFNIADLWQPVNHSRQQVFEFRDKVSGTGGRRLPHGVHGAHGQFNRLQWTLDGKPRLVDVYGRTQKEVEEEARADPRSQFSLPVTEEDEEDVVEHSSIKPMWLLRLFTRWGARWGAHPTEQHLTTNGQDSVTSSALEPKTDSGIIKLKSPSANKSSD
ncbi:hypothetical protein F5887DRAFT_937473 [Amanita rubescens]|nr:hypothetical protein F5887DRAFT_937473 [Amanita rubescens]